MHKVVLASRSDYFRWVGRDVPMRNCFQCVCNAQLKDIIYPAGRLVAKGYSDINDTAVDCKLSFLKLLDSSAAFALEAHSFFF